MADKKYKIIVSYEADAMLKTHIAFLAKVNREASKSKAKEIMSAIRSLSVMPERFPFFKDEFIPSNKYHKMFIPKWYIVLYQIKDDTVYVDYVLDCRRDYGWLIQ